MHAHRQAFEQCFQQGAVAVVDLPAFGERFAGGDEFVTAGKQGDGERCGNADTRAAERGEEQDVRGAEDFAGLQHGFAQL